ncbi:hypothetical protein AAFX91_28020 [Bradyrhizobium sp. 31Argb]|uniref:hypothetical protein n=1 Tax=Bradyrhizobium sp. 31Argb TaxID=3141247 RepID=UPI003747AD28
MMARARRSIEEAREFGRLVELERSRPRASLKTIFQRIRRSNPKPWKGRSERTMFRLWADFKKDRKQNPLQAEFAEWWQRQLQGKGGKAPKLRKRRPNTGRLDFNDRD